MISRIESSENGNSESKVANNGLLWNGLANNGWLDNVYIVPATGML